jgi:4-hydroxy-tetrahydrodipicolinate reductase
MKRTAAMTSSPPIRIGVGGALGRMGRAIVSAAREREDVTVSLVFDRPELAGQSVEGFAAPLRDAAAAVAECEVIIDFSTPAASVALARACAEAALTGFGPALVIGTTGLSADDHAALAEAAKQITIVHSNNFSVGLNMMLGLVRQAAAALPAGDWDIEIVEAHHRRKVDAPSGTALTLGAAAAEGRGVNLPDVSERGRDGITGPRARGAIGFSSIRGGGIVGEHSVIFASEDEIFTFSHSARDRSQFARGALMAAVFAFPRNAGLCTMLDVLWLGAGDL